MGGCVGHSIEHRHEEYEKEDDKAFKDMVMDLQTQQNHHLEAYQRSRFMSMDQNLSQPIKHDSEEKLVNVIEVSPYLEKA